MAVGRAVNAQPLPGDWVHFRISDCIRQKPQLVQDGGNAGWFNVSMREPMMVISLGEKFNDGDWQWVLLFHAKSGKIGWSGFQISNPNNTFKRPFDDDKSHRFRQ